MRGFSTNGIAGCRGKRQEGYQAEVFQAWACQRYARSGYAALATGETGRLHLLHLSIIRPLGP